MKEIVIIVISILIVIVGSNISLGYLTKTGDDLIVDIDELKQEIEKNKKGEGNNSIVLSKEIYDKWQDVQQKWSIIITHNELDLIEMSIIGMKTGIEEKEYEKAIEELEKSRFLLKHIQDKEKLDFRNIF